MSMTSKSTSSRGGLSRVLALSLALCMLISLAVPFQAGAIMPYDPFDEVPQDSYEVDNYPMLAKDIAVNAPPQARTIHDMMDTDWVKFDVVEDATYIVRTTAPADTAVVNGGAGPEALADITGDFDGQPIVYTFLELYDQSGQSVLEYAWADGPMATARIVWKAEATGSLYAKVTSIYGADSMVLIGDEAPDVEDVLNGGYATSPFSGQYLLSVSSGRQEVRGFVRADDTGDPIDGASVFLWRWENPPGPRNNEMPTLFETKSAPDGAYFFDHLPNGYYWLEAGPYDNWCLPYGWDSEEFWLPDERIADRGVNLWLPPATFAGKVTNESGEGLSGIQVQLSYWTGSFWSTYGGSTTGPTGCWSYWGLPTGYQYRVQFMDYDGVYMSEWYDDTTLEASATLLPKDGPWNGNNTTHDVDATLEMAPAMLTGKVTDERGKPIANHPVVAFSQGVAMSWVAWTGSDGTYAIRNQVSDMPTATVKVLFDDLDGKHVREWYDNAASEATATALAVTSGAPVTGVDAVLADAPPYLEGQVLDEVTGEPIEGVEVWLYYDAGRVFRAKDYVRTDKNGTYSFSGYVDSHMAHKVRFYDPSQKYASEYWDDMPSLADADEIYFMGGSLPGESADISIETDDSPFPPDGTFTADAELSMKISRSTGVDRYQSAINVAQDQFPWWDSLDDVIIASGEDRSASDALAAAGLSWLYDAPILLTSSKGASSELLDAISNMSSDVEVHVVGGRQAVPDAVVDQILALDNVGNEADRIWGQDRYGTAAEIAARMYTEGGEGMAADAVFLANGSDWDRFWDALALSAPTANTGIPILLVTEDSIPEPTMAILEGAEPQSVYIAGGPVAVNPVVKDEIIATGAVVDRWWGQTRYGTAVDVAEGAIARGWLDYSDVGIAGKVPDAMSGGSAIGRQGGPLLLTGTDYLPPSTKDFLSLNKSWIDKCTVFGGPAAVSEDVRDEITVTLN